MVLRSLLITTSAALALSACGSDSRAPQHETPPAARAAALPAGRELARRLAAAFRVSLRELSVADGAAGEAGDQGQPVPTGVVDRATCTARRRCVVRWLDVTGKPHRTRYVVTPAPRGCFQAEADPALPAIRDIPSNATTVHPLQEVAGGC